MPYQSELPEPGLEGLEGLEGRPWEGRLTVPPDEFLPVLDQLPVAMPDAVRAAFHRFRLEPVDVDDLATWSATIPDPVTRALVVARTVELAHESQPLLADLASRAATVLEADGHPLLGAIGAAAVARVAGLDERFSEFELQARAACRNLPAGTWLHNRALEAYALHLAYGGRLYEVADLLPRPRTAADLAASAQIDPFPIIRFIDAVEAGRCREAEAHIAAIEAEGAMVAGFEELIAVYDSLLMLIDHANLARLEDMPPEVRNEEETAVLLACLGGDVRSMHRFIETGDYAEVTTPSSLFGLRSVRLALGLSDQELARTLLERRQDLGLGHPLDDFFQARIARLDGDEDGAVAAMGRAVRAAAETGAGGRLEFEMRCAAELTPLDLVRLGGGGLQRRTSVSTMAGPDPLAMVVGGSRLADLHKELNRFAAAGVPVALVSGVGGGRTFLAQTLARYWRTEGEVLELVGADNSEPIDRQRLVVALAGGGVVVRGLEEASGGRQAQILAALDLAASQGSALRFIASTSQALAPLVADGRLLAGLAAHLAGAVVVVAPLIDRRDEIPDLVRVGLRHLRHGRPAVAERSLLDRLAEHDWPWGVRELHAVIGGLVARHPVETRFTAGHLAGWWAPGTAGI